MACFPSPCASASESVQLTSSRRSPAGREPAAPRSGSEAVPVHAGRAQRAARNFLETFPLFAAALVCAIAIHHDGHLAQLGATLYFWARVAYLPIYLLGIPGIRSLAWITSLVGLLLVVAALF